jgi:hypothetical protein
MRGTELGIQVRNRSIFPDTCHLQEITPWLQPPGPGSSLLVAFNFCGEPRYLQTVTLVRRTALSCLRLTFLPSPGNQSFCARARTRLSASHCASLVVRQGVADATACVMHIRQEYKDIAIAV